MTPNPDESVARACRLVPGFLQATLVLLPEGLLIGSAGLESALDGEPLARAAARCLANADDGTPTPFVEHTFVSADRFVVVLRSRRDQRLALALSCSREANMQLVITSTRGAFKDLETSLDWGAWQE